ncbi:MAG: hypothetical protein WC254_04995 [Candidatus Woesearchaeota archaeon]|jgi:hypothetical protein
MTELSDYVITNVTVSGKNATICFKDKYVLEIFVYTSMEVTTGIERVVLKRNGNGILVEILGEHVFPQRNTSYSYQCFKENITQQEMGERIQAAKLYCENRPRELNAALQIVTADNNLIGYLIKNSVPIK